MEIREYRNDTLLLTNSYIYKDFIQEKLSGAKWDVKQKAWIVPFSVDNIKALIGIRCEIPKRMLEKYNNEKEALSIVTKEKMAEDSEPIESMPIKAKPYKHQIIAYNIAYRLMDLFKKEGNKTNGY